LIRHSISCPRKTINPSSLCQVPNRKQEACSAASQSPPATHAAYKVVRRRGYCSGWAFGSNRTVRFLGSGQNSVPTYQGPFGSLSVQEPANFGFGSIGSVPVLTEGTDLFQDEKQPIQK
jgi:hypothetical protein